jgi:hypothetical protein
MPKRFAFLCAIPLYLGMSVSAQPQDVPPTSPRTLWDHNGSVMYLIANESSREFYYQKPRPGMLEAGAHPDSLLFKGQIDDGQMLGTAYIFNAQCGPVPFEVKGPILDNGGRIVLTGQVPRIGRNCQANGNYTSTLEFRLLKTAEIAQPRPAATETPNVEEPNPGSPSSAVGEPKLPITAQPTQTARTPTTGESNPNVPSSAAGDANLPGNPLPQAPAAAHPPNMQEPKSQVSASAEKMSTTPSAQPSLTTLAPASTQGFMDKSLLAPIIIALNVALPLFSLLFLVVMLKSSA